MLELQTTDAAVSISPADGGRLASLRVGGRELLISEPDPNPMLWGCFPMVPWAGRVRHGRFEFDDVIYELPLGMPPHAIHGTTYTRPWALDTDGSLLIDLGPDWPFGGHAKQHFSLEPGRLTCTIEVHAGSRPMPAQAGWHPWFRRPVELTFAAGAMYARDDEGIPTGQLVDAPDGPWDDCFTQVLSPPQLTWPDGPTLTISSTCDHWVVFDELAWGLCVEPQTGPPDGFTLHPRLIEPGRPLVATMTFTWA
ncbi:MAG TPA: hypothetical protein VF855_10300 [Acidimicrobiales bacterium]